MRQTAKRQSSKINPINILRLVAVNAGVEPAEVERKLGELRDAQLEEVISLATNACRFAQTSRVVGLDQDIEGYRDDARVWMGQALKLAGIATQAGDE